MAGLVPKADIEELRARNDIVEVVGAHIELKRAGGRYKALCPFHKEQTPSFHVDPNRQIYHCFGCGVGGDVFRFVMEYEGIDFTTALTMLAERSNYRLETEPAPRPKHSGPSKDLLYKVLDQAATLYQRVLREHPQAASARAYIEQRGIHEEEVKRFRIGYAPSVRDHIRSWGRRTKFSDAALVGGGLIAKSDSGGYYDRFRDRLMFPIHDVMGRVIGFSGRILREDAKAAKYVNSPETLLFHKSHVLYALDKAREGIVRSGAAIVCEGQIDAIRCHEAGIDNVVASQGTALTESQASLIKRYGDSVVLILDADSAGQTAAIRSSEAFISVGLNVRIATLPPGEDPDSLILSQGRDAILGLVAAAQSVVDFQINVLEARSDGQSEQGRQKAIQSVLETISKIPSAVHREELIRQLSQRYFVAEHLLREDLAQLHRSRRSVSRPDPKGPSRRPEHPRTETSLIELMIEFDSVSDIVRTFLPIEDFTDPDCRRIASEVIRHGHDLEWDLMENLADASDECLRLAAEIQMAPHKLFGDETTPEFAARDMILYLRRKSLERVRMGYRQEAERTIGIEKEKSIRACQQLSVDINRLKQGWDEALPILELG